MISPPFPAQRQALWLVRCVYVTSMLLWIWHTAATFVRVCFQTWRTASVSSPRCLLHCLQVNTGATRACSCLCSKQPSLLWLQSKQVRQRLHMSSFVLIPQRRGGTGDSCSLISGGIQTCLHTGCRQMLQRRLKVMKLLLSAVLYSSFILSFSILDCSHRTVGGITRRSAQGARGGGCILLGVRAGKKAPLSQEI